MLTTIPQVILATALSTPPPLARAEVEVGPDSAHVLAYGAEGDVAAEIVVSARAEEIRLDALFPDGTSLNAVIDADGDVTVECEDYEAARVQIIAVQDLLNHVDPQKSWIKCAAYAAITAWELSHASPIGVATGILAACECLPEIVDEFEAIECY